MNCEQISEKAIELGLTKEDIEIIKQPYNGWIIVSKKDKDIHKLKEYVTEPKK